MLFSDGKRGVFMPIEMIQRISMYGSDEEKMSVQLAFHCAPILKGVKAANILTVSGKSFRQIGVLLQGTSISYRFLKTNGKYSILYLYRRKKLEEYLAAPEIRKFLKNFGYPDGDVKQLLDRLSERVRLYRDGESAFPHEIGIFLEYPLGDVQGFVKNQGRNYLYSGYWKVYHDLYSALKRFASFDEKRELALAELEAGMSIREMAV